jgi:hypothetical protein
MRDILAGFGIGILLLLWWSPENAGRTAHLLYNSLVIGWGTVN